MNLSAYPLLAFFYERLALLWRAVEGLRRGAHSSGVLFDACACSGKEPDPGAEPPRLNLDALAATFEAILVTRDASAPSSDVRDPLAAVRYALVALVDEWLLHDVSWPGREAWCDCPLEHRLFGTRVAGRELFHEMRELGRAQRTSSERSQLAHIYLVLLDVGFAGAYRGRLNALIGLRSELRSLLGFGVDAADGFVSKRFAEGVAFPQAYQHNAVGEPDQQAAADRRFSWVIAFGFAIYLSVAAALWFGSGTA